MAWVVGFVGSDLPELPLEGLIVCHFGWIAASKIDSLTPRSLNGAAERRVE